MAGLWLAAAPVSAQEPAQDPGAGRQQQIERLRELETALAQSRRQQEELGADAERLAGELADLQGRLIAAAELVLRQEAEIGDITRRLAALQAEERAKAAALQQQREGLSRVLASLAHLSRQPPLVVAAEPAHAVDAVHTSLLLAAVLPALEARAAAVGAELQAVRAIRAEIAAQQAELAAANERLQQERAALAALLDLKAAERVEAQVKQLAARERTARLGAEANDLRDLIGRLEGDGGLLEEPPEGVRPFAEARGRLPLPAKGRIVLSYGEEDAQGLPSRGLSLELLESAQVVAPYNGRIVFAGPFRSYGQLLIIAHGEGYHTLIAGLSRIDGFVGQWLLAGEPVGQAGTGENGISAIYVELRRNGEPINPLPWLAAR